MTMFCYQCEQTAKESGCTAFGVCGKDPDTAALQDILVHALKGLAVVLDRSLELGGRDPESAEFVAHTLFMTLTNVNFDAERHVEMIHRAVDLREQAKNRYWELAREAGVSSAPFVGPATFEPALTISELVRQGEAVAIPAREEERGELLVGLEELVLYGLKGLAAYVDHARILGKAERSVDSFFIMALAALTTRRTVDELLAAALEVGRVNLRAMELLDRGHTEAFGHPEPTEVRVTPREGKAILVSGHDLLDLKVLLEQTEGTGINVYTHGEMLPAHGYPGLKRFEHLAGNFGGAWQDQRKEFEQFPGAILMTTNCIQKPKASYQDLLFTSGAVGWPGVRHLEGRDFRPLIEAALEAPGFDEDGPHEVVVTGFAHNAVLGVADKVISAVKQGAIRHFFLVGGCDGAKSGRNYYTEFVEQAPEDTVILTLACGKYRFIDQKLGDIGGIPRLLDLGQCNDAHSAVKIATALAEAFETDVNGLPLSFVLSWFEQKAVVILLSLLHLGIKGIRLGPSLPAFIKPEALGVLVDKFDLTPITTPEADLAGLLKPSAP